MFLGVEKHRRVRVPHGGVQIIHHRESASLGLYRLLRTRLPSEWAVVAASLGPWAAGWSNLGLLLRGAAGV